MKFVEYKRKWPPSYRLILVFIRYSIGIGLLLPFSFRPTILSLVLITGREWTVFLHSQFQNSLKFSSAYKSPNADCGCFKIYYTFYLVSNPNTSENWRANNERESWTKRDIFSLSLTIQRQCSCLLCFSNFTNCLSINR